MPGQQGATVPGWTSFLASPSQPLQPLLPAPLLPRPPQTLVCMIKSTPASAALSAASAADSSGTSRHKLNPPKTWGEVEDHSEDLCAWGSASATGTATGGGASAQGTAARHRARLALQSAQAPKKAPKVKSCIRLGECLQMDAQKVLSWDVNTVRTLAVACTPSIQKDVAPVETLPGLYKEVVDYRR